MGILGDKLTHNGRNLYIEVEQTTPELCRTFTQQMGGGARY